MYEHKMEGVRRKRLELTARREAIERRIALREATAAEYSAIALHSYKQKWKSLRTAAVVAQKRNDAFIQEVHDTQCKINEVYLRTKQRLWPSYPQHDAEKENYFRKIEELYPAWHEKQQVLRVQKLRELENKKRMIDKRRQLAKKTFESEQSLEDLIRQTNHEIELAENLEKNESLERDVLRSQSVLQANQLDQTIREHAMGARMYVKEQAMEHFQEMKTVNEDIKDQIFETFSPRATLSAMRRASKVSLASPQEPQQGIDPIEHEQVTIPVSPNHSEYAESDHVTVASNLSIAARIFHESYDPLFAPISHPPTRVQQVDDNFSEWPTASAQHQASSVDSLSALSLQRSDDITQSSNASPSQNQSFSVSIESVSAISPITENYLTRSSSSIGLESINTEVTNMLAPTKNHPSVMPTYEDRQSSQNADVGYVYTGEDPAVNMNGDVSMINLEQEGRRTDGHVETSTAVVTLETPYTDSIKLVVPTIVPDMKPGIQLSLCTNTSPKESPAKPLNHDSDVESIVNVASSAETPPPIHEFSSPPITNSLLLSVPPLCLENDNLDSNAPVSSPSLPVLNERPSHILENTMSPTKSDTDITSSSVLYSSLAVSVTTAISPARSELEQSQPSPVYESGNISQSPERSNELPTLALSNSLILKGLDSSSPTKLEESPSPSTHNQDTSLGERESLTAHLSMSERLKALTSLISRVEESGGDGEQLSGSIDTGSSVETKRELLKMATSGRKAQVSFFGTDICFEVVVELARGLGLVLFPSKAFDGIMNEQKMKKVHQCSKEKELDIWKILSNHIKQLSVLKMLPNNTIVDIFTTAFLQHDPTNQRSQRKLREFLLTICGPVNASTKEDDVPVSPTPRQDTTRGTAVAETTSPPPPPIPSLLQTAFMNSPSSTVKSKQFNIANGGIQKKSSTEDLFKTMASSPTSLSQKLIRGGKMGDYSEFEDDEGVNLENLIGTKSGTASNKNRMFTTTSQALSHDKDEFDEDF